MKTPRDWNGEDIAAKLAALGFSKVRQSGSHIMVKHDETGEVISVPSHRPLKVGTLSALLRDLEELTALSREEILRRLK